MERQKSFDFGAILKNNQKKHKIKPPQFGSVAGGVLKRLETSIKCRRSSRFTIFDSIRNLSPSARCESPTPKQKIDHRRQQLEKWKEEKEKKKKDQASQKKKAFVVGVPKVHNPLKYVPPPPIVAPKALPSTSGRVTRSQSARIKKDACESKKAPIQSFAPKNAKFHAPEIKNLAKLPKLVAVKPKPAAVSFEPTPHLTAVTEAKQTRSIRSRITKQSALDTRITRSVVETRPKSKVTKINSKPPTFYLQSSSSSENEQPSINLTSSSDNDLNKILNTSSDNNIDKTLASSSSSDMATYNSQSSTENDSVKSLQSSSSTEQTEKKQLSTKKSRKSIHTTTPSQINKTPHKSANQQVERKSLRIKNTMNTPSKPIPKSESSSEERLRSPNTLDVPMTPQQIAEEAKKISPCVTMSRGKDNARKEMKQKLAEGLLDEESCSIDGVDHFRRQLASEIKRMTEMCDTWDRILEQVALPDTVQEKVLSAVGQARLLMTQKLQQFAKLVELCARPEPAAALVTPADLQGFWDMVFIQVVNVDLRFNQLEALKARNWTEVQPVQAKRKSVKAAKPAARPKAAAPSRLKEMIAAARKAKKEEAQPAQEERTFEAGFFRVTSPARAAAPATPRAATLLKAVLSSEAKKASATKSSASFAMLRASVLGKSSVDCEGVAPLPQTPITQVNLHATPGRSILKQGHESTKLNKSIKMVLFQSENKHNSSTELSSPNHKEQGEIDPDSGLSSLDTDKELAKNHTETEKSPSVTRKSLTHQDAIDEYSPIKTRNRRKTIQTPQTEITTRSSKRNVVLQEVDSNVETEKTPRRSGRKKKVVEEVENVEEKTPKRNSRRRKSAPQSVA